jgi:hypothetical protein
MRTLLVALVLLGACASAQAHVPYAAEAQRVAARFNVPCPNGVIVYQTDVLMEGGRVAYAYPNRYTGQCFVAFAYHVHNWGFRSICTAMLHEYGHLMGWDHSPNPRSLMYYAMNEFDHRCNQPRRSIPSVSQAPLSRPSRSQQRPHQPTGSTTPPRTASRGPWLTARRSTDAPSRTTSSFQEPRSGSLDRRSTG